MALLATGWDRERLKARELLGASARGAAGGRPLRDASVLHKHKNQSRHRDVSQHYCSEMVPTQESNETLCNKHGKTILLVASASKLDA